MVPYRRRLLVRGLGYGRPLSPSYVGLNGRPIGVPCLVIVGEATRVEWSGPVFANPVLSLAPTDREGDPCA